MLNDALKEIRSNREASNAAIAAHDVAAIGSYWTGDYHAITSRDAEASGRKKNMERFQADINAKPDVIYVRRTSSVEVMHTWNMAAEHGAWTGSWTEGTDRISISGSYYAKWHKVNGKWLIRAEIFVPLHCEGGRYCDEGPLTGEAKA